LTIEEDAEHSIIKKQNIREFTFSHVKEKAGFLEVSVSIDLSFEFQGKIAYSR